MSTTQFVELVVGGLALGAIYGLVGLGFSMIMRATDILHFAQGEVMMLGAMCGWTAVMLAPMPFILVLLIGMVSGGVVAVIVYLAIYRTMRVRQIPIVYIAISTVGVSIVLQNMTMLSWGSEPLAYPKLFATEVYRVGPATFSPQTLWIIALGFGLMFLLQAFLKFTRTGIALQAIAQDPETAQLVGINLTRSTTLTFGIGGLMAGAAGVLLGSMFYASFNMGFLPGIKAFVAATLGGIGSIGGAMLGGIVFGLIEMFSPQFISSNYRDAVGMLLLILVLLVLPGGLISLFKRTG